MCFTEPIAWSMVIGGTIIAALNYIFAPELYFMSIDIAFLVLMELIQALSFPVLNDCNHWWNKAMTIAGYVHICFQPAVLTYGTYLEYSYLKQPNIANRFKFVATMSTFGALFMLWRFLSEYNGFTKSVLSECPVPETEWVRDTKGPLCTWMGKHHLGWSIPLADVSYMMPGMFIHFFNMHAPLLCSWDDPKLVVKGILVLLTGPILPSLITDKLGEQPAIWCLYSVAFVVVVGIPRFFNVYNAKLSKKKL
jgi:hypothetical protein